MLLSIYCLVIFICKQFLFTVKKNKCFLQFPLGTLYIMQKCFFQNKAQSFKI